jgi:xylose isomerase
MRTYLILKDKAERWNNHEEIKDILAAIEATNANGSLGSFDSLRADNFDRVALASKGLKYERLDQLTIDILLGVD